MNPRSLWCRRWSIECVAAAMLILPFAVSLATPTSAQEESDQGVTTITLNEVNDSGVSGTVRLSPNGDQTEVAVRLTGATGNHPNHIHENFCANVDPDPLLPLTHIVVGEVDPDGFTTTTVDMPLDELLAGEFSILVHLSDDQLDQYLACGNIATGDVGEEAAVVPAPGTPTVDAASAPEPAGGAGGTDVAVTDVATTGVGTGIQPNLRLALVVVSLAVLSAAVAIGAARRIRLS